MSAATTYLCATCESKTADALCPSCGLPTVPAVLDGRYELISAIGKGGMGTVYRGLQRSASREVAIKIIDSTDPRVVQRFMREATLTARLEHPNAIRVYDSGLDATGSPYLVMELLRGHDLAREIRTAGPMPLARAVGIATQALKALHVAHGQGIIHRDIKPANIFLHHTADEQEIVKVMDFGIAVLSDPTPEAPKLTQTGQVFGTPAYMSPEQLQEIPLDARADLYAMGLVFYEMLSGTCAFHADTPVAIAMKQMMEAPPRLAARRPDLESRSDVQAVIDRMLAKQREERPVSAIHAVALLQKLLPSPVELSNPQILGLSTADFTNLGSQGLEPKTVEMGPTLRLNVEHEAEQPPKNRYGLVAAGGAVLAIAIGLVVAFRPAAEPRAVTTIAPVDVRAAPPPAPLAPPTPRRVTFDIRSRPDRARVMLGGKELGLTPLRHALDASDTEIELRLEKDGYRPLAMQIAAKADNVLELELQAADEKKKKPPRTRTARRARPRDTDTDIEPEDL